jgi:hypothetical protein
LNLVAGHIFVWEGLITAGTGIFLFFLYPNRSETTTMLSEEERKLTALRVGSSVSGSKRGEFTHLSLTQVKEVVFNPIVLAATWFYIIGESLLCWLRIAKGAVIFVQTVLL